MENEKSQYEKLGILLGILLLVCVLRLIINVLGFFLIIRCLYSTLFTQYNVFSVEIVFYSMISFCIYVFDGRWFPFTCIFA